MTRANVTTDHKQIRKWAEARRGKPATMKDTEEGGEVGILRLDFDPPDKGLEKISWDEFFEKFDQAALAFLYQEKTAGGKTSRFHKFVDRSNAEDQDEGDED